MLTLADGRLLAASGRASRSKRRHNDLFPFDIHYLDRSALEEYGAKWFDALGGYRASGLEATGDYAACREMLDLASTATMLSVLLHDDVSHDEPPRWDAQDTAVRSIGAVACSVVGFTPAVEDVAALGLPRWLRRELLLEPAPVDVDLSGIPQAIRPLIREAHHNIWRSPRASVALYRSVGEAVVAQWAEADDGSFAARLADLQLQWNAMASPHPHDAQFARDRANRERIIACLQTLRDLGNRIHAGADVTSEDAEWAHGICIALATILADRDTLQRPTPIVDGWHA